MNPKRSLYYWYLSATARQRSKVSVVSAQATVQSRSCIRAILLDSIMGHFGQHSMRMRTLTYDGWTVASSKHQLTENRNPGTRRTVPLRSSDTSLSAADARTFRIATFSAPGSRMQDSKEFLGTHLPSNWKDRPPSDHGRRVECQHDALGEHGRRPLHR